MLQLAFVNFKQNSYIQVEGTPATSCFYIIQSGKIRCFHETEVPGNAPRMLGPGDFIGVVACMSSHSQTESVIAITNVVAIKVNREQYPELIMKNTPVAMKIVRSFAQEMRVLNDNLTKITLKNTVTETPDQLFPIAQYYEDSGWPEIAAYCYYQYLKECPNGKCKEQAIKRFSILKKRTNPPYLEPKGEMMRSYKQNTMIFSECQSGADMFIVQSGSVKIVKVVDGSEVMLALLKKGDIFGEMALLDNRPRSACAIAHDDCTLMVINRTNFDQMVSTQPQLVARLTSMFAERLWSMYRQLANTELRNPREKMVDMLALQVEKSRQQPVKGVPFETDFTITDIINLCGIPSNEVRTAAWQLESDQNVKVKNGKIVVPDVEELIKQAAFYRKQNSKHANEQ